MIHIEHVDGPVGVQSRNFSTARIYSLDWEAKVFLKERILLTYPWIEAQVKAQRACWAGEGGARISIRD